MNGPKSTKHRNHNSGITGGTSGGGTTTGGTTGGTTGSGSTGGGSTGGGTKPGGGTTTPTVPKPGSKPTTPGLTTDGGPLDPANEGPITGVEPVDGLVRGLAGAIKPLEVTVKCALWSLTQPNPLQANKDCVSSYK
ncbi:hypothetical protein [Nocardioides convexus]|uniref:hypothetical protein n=1 Tax=Nocardioides convexus TaxID=2712224 RepID=UPI0024186AE2|nr:hypothetical protein [Nocardioides convexus]